MNTSLRSSCRNSLPYSRIKWFQKISGRTKKPDNKEKQEQLKDEMHKGQAEEDIVEKQVLDEFDAVVKSIPSEEEITSLDASRDDEPKQKPLSLVDPVVEKGVSVNRSALEKIVS